MTHNTISQKQNIPPLNWFPEEIEIQVGLPPRHWAIFLPISWLVMTQWWVQNLIHQPGIITDNFCIILHNDWHWHKYEYSRSQLMMMTGMFYWSPPLLSYLQLTDSCWWTPLRMLVLLLMASQLSHTKPLKFQLIKQITLRAWLAFYSLPQNHENWNVCLLNIFERCRCVGIWIWTPSDTWSRLFCFPRDENTIPGLITPRSEVTVRETTSMGITSHLIGKAL